MKLGIDTRFIFKSRPIVQHTKLYSTAFHPCMNMKESTRKFLDYLGKLKQETNTGTPTHDMLLRQFTRVVEMPDTVTYVSDYRSGKVIFHKGFDTVLDYPKGCRIDIPFVLNLTHGEDQPVVHYLTQIATEFHFEKDKNEPFETMFEINFRVRKFDGSHVMMLKRSCGFMNENGEPVAIVSMLHDISFMKVNQIHSRVLGPKESERLYFEKLQELSSKRYEAGPFSKRETQILALMAQGLKSQEIADHVNLSIHTIYNHRKNMMWKTGLKNTAELIRYGLENGLL